MSPNKRFEIFRSGGAGIAGHALLRGREYKKTTCQGTPE